MQQTIAHFIHTDYTISKVGWRYYLYLARARTTEIHSDTFSTRQQPAALVPAVLSYLHSRSIKIVDSAPKRALAEQSDNEPVQPTGHAIQPWTN